LGRGPETDEVTSAGPGSTGLRLSPALLGKVAGHGSTGRRLSPALLGKATELSVSSLILFLLAMVVQDCENGAQKVVGSGNISPRNEERSDVGHGQAVQRGFRMCRCCVIGRWRRDCAFFRPRVVSDCTEVEEGMPLDDADVEDGGLTGQAYHQCPFFL